MTDSHVTDTTSTDDIKQDLIMPDVEEKIIPIEEEPKDDSNDSTQAESLADDSQEKVAHDEEEKPPSADLHEDTPTKPSGEPTPSRMLGSTHRQSGERNWYVIHTYSGYEDQVSESLIQRIDLFGMKDKIFDVIVPKEKQIEIKGGKRKVVEKRIFPGYVLVDMVVTDESWFVVRNTPNVTGFIGFGVKPTPMSNQEVDRIKKRMGVEEPKYKIELKIDDLVRVNDGPLKGFEGKVTDIDEDKGRVKVLVSMFGRETPVTLDYLQVKSV